MKHQSNNQKPSIDRGQAFDLIVFKTMCNAKGFRSEDKIIPFYLTKKEKRNWANGDANGSYASGDETATWFNGYMIKEEANHMYCLTCKELGDFSIRIGVGYLCQWSSIT